MGKRDKKRKRREQTRKNSIDVPTVDPRQVVTSRLQLGLSSGGQSTPQHTHASDETIKRVHPGQSPPAVLNSDARNRGRSTVQFVYPRGNRKSPSDLVPYTFDRERTKIGTRIANDSNENLEKKSMTMSSICERDSSPARRKGDSQETIDDILDGTTAVPKHEAIRTKDRQSHSHSTQSLTAQVQATVKGQPIPEADTRKVAGKSVSPCLPVEARTESAEAGHLSGLSVEDAVRDKHGCRPRANSTDFELKLPRRGLCDERSVLECYRWKQGSNDRRSRPRGFVNCGNTCFLNATLQCLAYLPSFAQCLMSLPRTSNGSVSNGQRITRLLSTLFREVHGIDQRQAHHDAISPRSIVNAVPTLGAGGSRNGYKFRPGRQEDAHEFLVHLLDAIHDGELRAAGINQQRTGWREKLPIPRLDETTFIHRIFGGYLRSQVLCTKCGYRSNTYDPFLDLALEVSKKSCNGIAAAFAEFTKKETLDSDNRWRCSGCKKDVRATKELTVFRGPLALCVQLKRFTYGGGFGGFAAYGGGGWGYGLKGASMMNGRGSKITKPIDFPSELQLPLSDGRKCEYGLTGVVIHVGGSSSSGHYTASVKRPGVVGHGQSGWYHMDDSFVEPISEREVLRHRDAYLLFYCRKEVKLEFPTPPPRASMTVEQALELSASRARAKAGSNASPVDPCPSERFSLKSSPDEKTSATETETKRLPACPTPKGDEDSHARPHVNGVDLHTPARESGGSDPPSGTGDDAESSSSFDSSGDHDSKTTSSPRHFSARVMARKVSPKFDERLEARVVHDRGKMMGKLEVKVGARDNRKAWTPKHVRLSYSKGGNQDLLGTFGVGTWTDGDVDDQFEVTKAQMKAREKVVTAMEKDERHRKRKMHADRWDAMLDEGKKKKLKNTSSKSEPESHTPKTNPFQRIQSSIQKMKHGRSKGSYRSGKRTTKQGNGSYNARRASF